MAKGITYFCNDSNGNVYNRYSAGHTAPRYIAATINSRADGAPVSKAGVNYTSSLHRAQLASGGNVEAVTVRAYPGKHAVEPQA